MTITNFNSKTKGYQKLLNAYVGGKITEVSFLSSLGSFLAQPDFRNTSSAGFNALSHINKRNINTGEVLPILPATLGGLATGSHKTLFSG